MIVLMIACGALTGLLALMLSKKLILTRAGMIPENIIISHKVTPILWCVFSALGFTVIYYSNSTLLEKAEYITVFTICLCISAVDYAIRKIPNSLLLALIISKITFLILRNDYLDVTKSLLGFATAVVIFTIPSFLKINVGAGDIKLAAVTGLYLGISGFLQAMIIMAVFIAIYGIYILIRRLGNLKTKTAMGPYLALGLICTLIFPIVN